MPGKGERAAAKAAGRKRYDGKACRHGHGTRRFTSNGNCCECVRLYYSANASQLQKNWRANNRETARAIGRRSEHRRRIKREYESFLFMLTN